MQDLVWNRCDSAALTLDDGELHLWMIALEHPPEGAASLLCGDERERLKRFRHTGERRRFLAARRQLRLILARYLGCSAAAISFAYGPKGKPEIADPPAGLHFSLSHSGELALLAIAYTAIGVDLEPIRARHRERALARRILDPATLHRLERLGDDGEHTKHFLREWTRLEARVKAAGAGLFDHPPWIKDLPTQSFVPTEGWIGAVAAQRPLPLPRAWRTWSE
ncbi:MAG: 4'-phosphopantetheinyl transferase superfamily protein [Candidatus Sedimenticola endophacoides]